MKIGDLKDRIISGSQGGLSQEQQQFQLPTTKVIVISMATRTEKALARIQYGTPGTPVQFDEFSEFRAHGYHQIGRDKLKDLKG